MTTFFERVLIQLLLFLVMHLSQTAPAGEVPLGWDRLIPPGPELFMSRLVALTRVSWVSLNPDLFLWVSLNPELFWGDTLISGFDPPGVS